MKRVAIVGAGVSGLPCIRYAVLYGVEPVCFEVAEDLGGLWRFKLGETEYSTVMRSTIINTSKEMMAYSDFPPPANEANFMHHRHMLKYFENYADHYKLRQYIRFQTKVASIRRADDYETSGRWNVTYKTPDRVEKTETFDGVLLAAGHHAKPNWPVPYPGQDHFKGRLIHSHDYKDAKGEEVC